MTEETESAKAVRPCSRIAARTLLKAAEGRLNFGIGRELAALGLSKTFQHGRKVRGINFLWLAAASIRSEFVSQDLRFRARL